MQPTPLSYFLSRHLIFSPHLRLGLPCGLFLSRFSVKICVHLSSPLYIPNAPLISFLVIWSYDWHSMRSTKYENLHYAVSFRPLLPRPN
jgi:hypothetical protein